MSCRAMDRWSVATGLMLCALTLTGCTTAKTEEAQASAQQQVVAPEQDAIDRNAAVLAQEAAWRDWYNSAETQAFIKQLCLLPEGPERQEQFAIAKKDFGLNMITCRPEWMTGVGQ